MTRAVPVPKLRQITGAQYTAGMNLYYAVKNGRMTPEQAADMNKVIMAETKAKLDEWLDYALRTTRPSNSEAA